MNEEITECWTRGDLNGEWLPSELDIAIMFEPDTRCTTTALEKANEYAAHVKDTMIPLMTTFDAYKYCIPLREKAIFKMKNLPWDTNLLNAFHNLHFTLFMADINPGFNVSIDPLQVYDNDSVYTVPGWPIWILQLIYHAASECLRDDFIKAAKKDPHDYRIDSQFTDDHQSVGMSLHLVSDICIDIWVTFIPKVNEDGTLGFNHVVELNAYHWKGNKANIAPRKPLRKNMLRMKEYIEDKLNQFAKTLKNAEFNSPMYALKNINGGNL